MTKLQQDLCHTSELQAVEQVAAQSPGSPDRTDAEARLNNFYGGSLTALLQSDLSSESEYTAVDLELISNVAMRWQLAPRGVYSNVLAR